MMPVEDLLYDYALGALDEADTRRVASSLATSAALRGELTAIEELLAGVAADLPAVVPGEAARARLMTVAETEERWTPFLKRMASLAGTSIWLTSPAEIPNPSTFLPSLF